MAISKQKKEQLLGWYAEKLSDGTTLIMTNYQGLTMSEITRLRRKIQGLGDDFRVVKNTLFKRALEEAGLPVPEDMLTGPTAIGFCRADIPGAIKALLDFARETKILQIKGGIMEGTIVAEEGVSSIADLPPREVLLAKVLGTLQAPGGRVAGAVAGVMRSLLYLLQVRAEQLEKQSA
ncbi:MAG: 50S ribosomal protein L10 [Anaerolineae bacterium]